MALSRDQKKSLHVLAYLMFRMGQDERARRIYAVLASLAPEGRPDRQALAALASIAIDRGQGAEALAHLRGAMEGALPSRAAVLYLMKAQALQLEGREAEARAARDEFLFVRAKGAESGAQNAKGAEAWV